MNKLATEKRAQIVSCLVEGNSIRSTARITRVSKNTVIKLLRDLGQVCSEYQNKVLRDLPCKRIECDEIWSFVQKKQKNLPELPEGQERHAFGIGDVWTFTAICPDTKLVPSWLVGSRDSGCAYEFMTDLSERLANRVQMTTDGHKMYLEAVEGAFGADIDYSMLHKLYGADPEPDKRYSPAKCIGVTHQPIMGDPDPDHVFDQHRGTAELEHENEHTPFHSVDQRFQQEGREPGPRCEPALYVLQLRSYPSQPSSDSSDGGRCLRARLERGRDRRSFGQERAGSNRGRSDEAWFL